MVSHGDSVTGARLGPLLADRGLALEPVHLPIGARARRVTWVHATEQVDPRPHLRPHEFVCTLGSSLVQPSACRAFARIVSAAGCAGIGLGLGEVHITVPEALIAACREYSIPLLSIPHETPFLAVNDSLQDQRNAAENQYHETETNLLGSLLRSAYAGSSAQDLVRQVRTTLLGSSDDPDSNGGESLSLPEAAGVSSSFAHQFAGIVEFAQIEEERLTQEHHARVGQLIELVEQGLAHPVALRPEFGVEYDAHVALQVSAWPEGSAAALRQKWPDAVIGVTNKAVLAITPRKSLAVYESLGLICGVSSATTLENLRRALAEARSALTLARARGSATGPSDLVTLDALLEQTPSEVLSRFAEQLLVPLSTVDSGGTTELIVTLRSYFAAGQRLQQTAESMQVHVNTIRNRLRRIATLSGRDPLSADGAVDLRIALWAADKRQSVKQRLTRQL